MKVVFPTCCGVDVHKSFLVATIIKTPKDSLQPSYQKKRFTTFNSDLKRFTKWLYKNDCLDVCMESTGQDFDPRHCVFLLRRSLKKKANDVLVSIEGYEIASEQKYRIGVIRDHLHYIEKLIERVDTCINVMVEKYDRAIGLLCTIPGIVRCSAITVISEIGVDTAQFGSSKRFCCWAGLTPGNNKSAGPKKSVRISRAEVYLKPALVQVAHAAVKDKTNLYYAQKYERIAKRREKSEPLLPSPEGF